LLFLHPCPPCARPPARWISLQRGRGAFRIRLLGPTAMPALPLQTAQAQLLWSQRIAKEEGVNTKVNPEGFSLRAAIRSVDVPKRFKPGHVDPLHGSEADGLDPTSKLAEEFRVQRVSDGVPPRDRYMYPETCSQDCGWYQKDPVHGPERSGRITIAGALPRAGIGWMKLLPPDRPQPEAPLAQRAKPRPQREVVGAAAHSRPNTQHAMESRSPDIVDIMQRLVTERGRTGESHARKCRSRHKIDVRGHPSLPGGTCLRVAGGTVSTPSLSSRSVAAEDPTTSPALEAAMLRSRKFMNRHNTGSGARYRPLGNSDVSLFAAAYSKCWGQELYGRASQSGSKP